MAEIKEQHKLMGDIMRAMDRKKLFSNDEEKVKKIDELSDYTLTRLKAV